MTWHCPESRSVSLPVHLSRPFRTCLSVYLSTSDRPESVPPELILDAVRKRREELERRPPLGSRLPAPMTSSELPAESSAPPEDAEEEEEEEDGAAEEGSEEEDDAGAKAGEEQEEES